ncbi:MAG: VCBS repeat-containing protein, partial [Planctomycetes bacterium]|nr:VCBS repeat-containing protein [Planctomycetota bacterium]
LPGIPQALDTGDLNEDGCDDVVTVSVNPALLGILLTNSPGPEVGSRPFYYPGAGQSGENAPGAATLNDLAFGFAGEDETEPLLAMISGEDQEIVIVFLDPSTGRPAGRTERHFVASGELDALIAADMDGVNGDDIIASTESGRLHLFRNSGDGGPRFLADGLLLDFVDGYVPPELQGLSPRTQKPLVAQLDPERLPDVLIPVRTDATRDFVAVLPAAGGPRQRPEIQLYRTLDDPRRLGLANVNGDAALDLLVACEGRSANGNKVHILFGNPAALSGGSATERIFFDQDNDPDPYRPLALDGLEADGEVEYLTTDNDAIGYDHPMRFLVASNDKVVSVYYNRMESPWDARIIDGPCEVYPGEDPERLMLLDLYTDAEGRPDLIIADEDAGKLIFLENVFPIPGEGCESIWEIREESFIEGSPEEFSVLYRQDPLQTLTLYVTTKTYPRLEVYERAGCPEDCQLLLVDPILIGEDNQRGRARGFALRQETDGGHLAAMLVEDRDRATDRPRVDLEYFPPATPAEEILNLGSLASPLDRCSILYEDGLLEQVDGVLLGRFIADVEAPGLLIHDGPSGRLVYQRGKSPAFAIDPEDPDLISWLPVVTEGEIVGVMHSPLLAWEPVSTTDAGDLVLAVTEEETCLFDVSSGALERLWSVDHSAAVRSASHGWLSCNDRRLANILVVRQDGELLVAHLPGSGSEIQVASGVRGLARAADVNGDGMEDIILADDRSSQLSVFLARKGRQFSAPLPTSFPVAVDAVDVEPLDANGDGYLDIAVGSVAGEVLLFFGNGTGALPEVSIEYASPDLEALESADLDADGRDEILVLSRIPGIAILRPGHQSTGSGDQSQ